MSERDELKELIKQALLASAPSDKYGLDAETEALLEAVPVADALLAAGYRKTRTVGTADIESADEFVDGTVIIDNQGEAWQKSDGMWYLAVGGYLDTGPADYLPVTVLFEPTKES